MRSAITRSGLVGASLALGLAACNPSDFNAVLDQAPVVAFSPSGASTGSLVALSLPPPGDPNSKVAARLLVARNNDRYLAAADYAKNGKVTLHEASAVNLAYLGPDVTGAIYSMAMRGDGTVIMGTPAFAGSSTTVGRVDFVSLQAQPNDGLSLAIVAGSGGPAGINHYGIAVAAGNVTGASANESVVVADEIVDLLDTNGALVARTGCVDVQLTNATTNYAFRPVAVGDLLTGGGDEIVLGGQLYGQGQGRVVFLQFDGTQNLVCPPTSKLLLQGTSNSFGTSLAIGDFNGDGKPDLAVGAPPDRVYIYLGPLDNVSDPSVTIISPPPLSNFGQRLAAYRVPGQAAAQLLVADPGATVGQRVGVGKVMLFNISGLQSSLSTTDAVATVFDSSEDFQPGVFGLNLGGLPFNTSTCQPGGAVQLVPWATSGTQILSYFAYPNGAADPRCF